MGVRVCVYSKRNSYVRLWFQVVKVADFGVARVKDQTCMCRCTQLYSLNDKKKKSRKSAGSSSRQSANDIYGDLDDFYKLAPENISYLGDRHPRKNACNLFYFPIIAFRFNIFNSFTDHSLCFFLLQLSEEITGPLPQHAMIIDMESNWILNQFKMGMVPWFYKASSNIFTD